MIIVKHNFELNPSIQKVLQIIRMAFKGIHNYQGNGAPGIKISIGPQMFIYSSNQISQCANPFIKGSIQQMQLPIGDNKCQLRE